MRKQWLSIPTSSKARNVLCVTYHGLVPESIQLLSKQIVFSVNSLVAGIQFLRLISFLRAHHYFTELPTQWLVTQELCGPRQRPRLDTRKFALFCLFALCLDLSSCVSDENDRDS